MTNNARTNTVQTDLAQTNMNQTEDWRAWQAICNWPEHSSVEVVRDRLDYGKLTRYFLWDKVPRAIRYQIDPEGFSFEQALLSQNTTLIKEAVRSDLPQPFDWEVQVSQPIKRLARIAGLRLQHWRRSTVFVPRVHPQLHSTIEALRESANREGSNIRLIAPFDPGNTLLDTFVVPFLERGDEAFAQQLYRGILQGLRAFDIELLAGDRATLEQQLLAQSQLIPQIKAELAAIQPQAVLVFADNHTPSQEYVAIANRQGIPTILLQHGLDCEQHCLSEAYASVLAVWGDARKRRYQAESPQFSARIEVTGNPKFGQICLPNRLHPGGERWLWATRPHAPYKCYSPSRLPREGLDILEALLAAVEQTTSAHLTIKPHPFDYADLYAEKIKAWGLGDRVSLSQKPLRELFSQSDIVISEDSTAALEAMFLGKVLIHAHFTAAPPVLPLVNYVAALPASGAKTLQTSLKVAAQLSTEDRDKMLNGQRKFIQDYAGPLDGKAQQRITALIEQTIFSSK